MCCPCLWPPDPFLSSGLSSNLQMFCTTQVSLHPNIFIQLDPHAVSWKSMVHEDSKISPLSHLKVSGKARRWIVLPISTTGVNRPCAHVFFILYATYKCHLFHSKMLAVNKPSISLPFFFAAEHCSEHVLGWDLSACVSLPSRSGQVFVSNWKEEIRS